MHLIFFSACPAGCQTCMTDNTTVTCTIEGCVADGFIQGPTKACVGKYTRSICKAEVCVSPDVPGSSNLYGVTFA